MKKCYISHYWWWPWRWSEICLECDVNVLNSRGYEELCCCYVLLRFMCASICKECGKFGLTEFCTCHSVHLFTLLLAGVAVCVTTDVAFCWHVCCQTHTAKKNCTVTGVWRNYAPYGRRVSGLKHSSCLAICLRNSSSHNLWHLSFFTKDYDDKMLQYNKNNMLIR
jgi:hypothetical protein